MLFFLFAKIALRTEQNKNNTSLIRARLEDLPIKKN